MSEHEHEHAEPSPLRLVEPAEAEKAPPFASIIETARRRIIDDDGMIDGHEAAGLQAHAGYVGNTLANLMDEGNALKARAKVVLEKVAAEVAAEGGTDLDRAFAQTAVCRAFLELDKAMCAIIITWAELGAELCRPEVRADEEDAHRG